MTLQNNRAPLLCYFKLCASFHTSVISNLSYSPETPNLGQMRRFLEPCDLEIWRMTLKNNRAPLQCYFKLCASFCSHWQRCQHSIFKMLNDFEIQGKTRQIWGIWKLRLAYSPETPNLGQYRWCFVPCDLEIWWMTLENNRAPLLCCFKLCATFHSHRWIQTGVAVRKRPIWVKFNDF